MPSIFDPPAGARTFNASDWLAAIDQRLQAPPVVEAEPPTEEPLPTWDTEPTAPPAATRRRLRNWPWAVLTWLVIAGGVNYVLYRACLQLIAAGHDYTLENLIVPALLVLAITTLELLIWLCLAWRFDCL